MSTPVSTAKVDKRTNAIPGQVPLGRHFLAIFRSSVGAKVLVAVTGILLTGFVIVHMLGNLQIFLGQEKINAYAKFLKDLGPLLWVARVGLLAVFLLHVVTAIRLQRSASEARPVPYAYKKDIQSTVESRYMIQTGLVILFFVVFHIAHYTLGLVQQAQIETGVYVNVLDLRDAQGRHDVYNMMIFGFRNPGLAVLYLAAQAMLLLHLAHGVSSVFQTLGLNTPRWQPALRGLGWLVALFVVAGNFAIVIGVWAGWVQPVLPYLVGGG